MNRRIDVTAIASGNALENKSSRKMTLTLTLDDCCLAQSQFNEYLCHFLLCGTKKEVRGEKVSYTGTYKQLHKNLMDFAENIGAYMDNRYLEDTDISVHCINMHIYAGDSEDVAENELYRISDGNASYRTYGNEPKTYEDVTCLACYHHVAFTKGYTSRYVNRGNVVPERYNGRYGEGWTVTLPSYVTNSYSEKEYWIKK